MVITLIVVSVCVFVAFSLIPGDPATRKLGTEATAEQVAALRAQMGLDAPLHVRYLTWITSFVKGDFGISYQTGDAVRSLLAKRIPVTFFLALIAFCMTVVIAIPVGILTAKYENSWPDRIVTVLNQIIMSVPPFFSGILLSTLFGLILRWFTPGAYVSYDTSFRAFLGYMLLPAFCVALPKAAMTIKLLRSSMIEEAGRDYTRTAYSRGNTIDGVMYGHILKNAMIPVVTFLGMALADLLAGSIVIEQLFSIPGISRTLITSISNRDYPVVMAVIMGIAATIVTVNLIVDLVYRAIDPRVSL